MPQRMVHAAILEGGCECGRNQYNIYVPAGDTVEGPEIRFDGNLGSRKSLRPYPAHPLF